MASAAMQLSQRGWIERGSRARCVVAADDVTIGCLSGGCTVNPSLAAKACCEEERSEGEISTFDAGEMSTSLLLFSHHHLTLKDIMASLGNLDSVHLQTL